MRSSRMLILVAVLLALPSMAAEAEPWKPPKTAGWTEARTANFTVYSNASSRATRKTAVELERFRQTLGRISRGLELDTQVPTSILLFRNDATYTPYKLDERGQTMNVSGYFLAGPFRNYITLDASADLDSMRVVYHEYFHAVMEATLGDLPLWLNEGLAEYFSTFHTRGGGSVVEVGHPIEEHLLFLDRRGLLRWTDVFRVTPDSQAYNEGSRQGAFYAQSWLIVHYLMATDERAAALGRYLTLLRDGADVDEGLTEALGMDRQTLATRVQEYLKTGSNYIWWDLGDEHAEVAVDLREMETKEVLFRLGDLLARRGQAMAARNHLQAAGAGGWPPAPIQNALGLLGLQDKDSAAAARHFREAMESGSAPVESYVFLAQIILKAYIDAAGDVPLSAGEVPEILEARSLLEAGLERDGRNFVALLDLARTYLLSGQTEAGVQALEKARVLRPLDLKVLHLGACLLARGGKPDEAWSVIARSLDPRNPDVAREAGDCVVEGTVIVAHERLSAGDREGAQEVLDRAMRSIDDLRLVGQLEPLQRTVSQGGTIVFEERQENPAAKRFDAILDLAQSGEYEEALRQLEAFVKDCTGADLCRAALENAKKLRVLVETNEQVARFNEAIDLANRGKRKPAIELLVELEKEVTDPKLLQSIQDMLRGLGHRPRK